MLWSRRNRSQTQPQQPRAPLRRQQTTTAGVCVHGRLREASFGFGQRERRATLVLAEQLEIPDRVLWAAQPEP
jgi:hypothetical protein